MIAPTFEAVLTQAQQLSPNERAQLIGMLAQDLVRPTVALPKQDSPKQDSFEERRARINAFRGKYRDSLSSVDEFLAAKREEVELEEARYLARHPEEARP
ncbi:MAG: hypothetical protein AAB401_20305 [Acidobacteriota bacterium]